MINHNRILTALAAWVHQRPGLEPGNYGCGMDGWRAYRQESARISRQLKDARVMLSMLEHCEPLTDAAWADAFRAFSGRLTWDADKGALSYCTGQYWPTEFRAAACAVMASAIWARDREGMPEPSAYGVFTDSTWTGRTWTLSRLKTLAAPQLTADLAKANNEHVSEVYGAKHLSAGDFLRAGMRSRFGARMQKAWWS